MRIAQTHPGRTLRRVSRQLDAMVAATGPERDRYLDFLRVLAIGVVVLWHWSLSVLHWSGDGWVMPNPIHTVPGGWLVTWPLQIMPVFFIVGGYANAGGWWSARRDGRGLRGYYTARLQRLLLPVAAFVLVWTVLDLGCRLLFGGYTSVLSYGTILFTPLWFIAAYVWVVLLTPLTATLHARARWVTLAVLAGVIASADLARFTADLALAGTLNTALVWVFIHQLGYFYRDGTLLRWSRPAAAALAAAALVAVALLTSAEAYPRSMVATVGQDRSNILPTTVTIAVVALLQLGLLLLLRAPVTRWLQRPGAWKPVIAGNTVILTVFVWHMTALLVVLALLRAAGVSLYTEPTVGWWLTRPLWVIAPALVLAPLVAVFGWFEWAGARGLRRLGTMTRP